MHPVDFLPSVPLLITQLPPTDTTNWSGAHKEWMTAVTRLESSSQEARTATSSFMTLLRSWLEGVMWSLLRVTGTRDQWELWTSTPFKYDPFSSCCSWTHCVGSTVFFDFLFCCRQTWLHQVGMSLKSISGTWITLALQWRQDRKPRCFIDFEFVENFIGSYISLTITSFVCCF